MRKVVQFVRDESGATPIEYGLIAAGISFAIVATVKCWHAVERHVLKRLNGT